MDFSYATFRLSIHGWIKVLSYIFLLIPVVMFVGGAAAFVERALFEGNLSGGLVVGGVILAAAAFLAWLFRPLYQAVGDPDASRVEFRDVSLVVICPFALVQRWPSEMEFLYANLAGVSEPTTESHFWGQNYPIPAAAGHVDVSHVAPSVMSERTGSVSIRFSRTRPIYTLHLHVDDPSGFRAELERRLPIDHRVTNANGENATGFSS